MFIYVPRNQAPVSEEERKSLAILHGVIIAASAVLMLLGLINLFRGPANIQTFWTDTTLYIKEPSDRADLVITQLNYTAEDGPVVASMPVSKNVLFPGNSAQAVSAQQLARMTWRTRRGVIVRPPRPGDHVQAFYHYENSSD